MESAADQRQTKQALSVGTSDLELKPEMLQAGWAPVLSTSWARHERIQDCE